MFIITSRAHFSFLKFAYEMKLVKIASFFYSNYNQVKSDFLVETYEDFSKISMIKKHQKKIVKRQNEFICSI